MPGGGGGGGGRETLRPPWVRDSGAPPSQGPKDPPAWTLRKRTSNAQDTEPPAGLNAVEEQLASVKAGLKKQGTRPAKSENGVGEKKEKADDNVAERVTAKVKELPSKEKKAETESKTKKTSPPKETVSTKKPPIVKAPAKDDAGARKPPVLQRQASKDDGAVKKWRDPLIEKVYEKIDNTLANEIPKGHTLTKNESLRSLLKPVPPPPPPPLPPKMPPPPEFKKSAATKEKLKRIEALKSRPRRRPDWTDMMKEVESGRKLKHVDCNDRSSPIININMVKAKTGQYVYESEKGNVHNQLLKQINSGIKLKTVKTNDRSRPNLDGLRKFRRQLTIEEQIQKSMSKADLSSAPEGIGTVKEEEAGTAEEEEVDEMDDIDKVRDDLQSTKQLLALELRNKEAMVRENKRMQARITNMEAELKSERAHMKQEQAKTVISVVDAYDETLVSSLKTEVTETKRVADDLQKKYHRAAEELDEVQSDLEEQKRKNAELEKKLEQALKGIFGGEEEEDEPKSYFLQRHADFQKQMETQGIMPNSNQGSRRPSHAQRQASIQESEPEEEEAESSGEEGEDEEVKANRRGLREMKLITNKIKNFKDKKEKARTERTGLRVQLKNQQKALKAERKKYKALKKEVDKMASLMKETDEDEEGENSEEEAEEEEEKSKSEVDSEDEESESESEDETESETESESEEEDAPMEQKKTNLTGRAKKHESSLNALKKGNYLIIANIDRLKDDVMKQREMSVNLQQDLDSVLAEFSA